MQRALSIAFALVAIALSAVLAWKSAPRGASAATSVADAGSTAPVASVTGEPPATPAEKGDKGGDAGGAPEAPARAAGSPKQVRFGVILVTYDGAEGAPSKGARSRDAALATATRFAEEAKSDFAAVVARGDTGSSSDLGQVTRGVLEPASEAVLFSLPVGGVSGVVDTPRGFWIVKRLE